MDSIPQVPSRTASWQQHINTWKNSGLSGPKFCQVNNLIYHRFVYWRKKLAIAEEKPQEAAPISSGFVQVAYASTEAESLQLTLPNGVAMTGINTNNIDIVRQRLGFL